jgi:hypothetical protein
MVRDLVATTEDLFEGLRILLDRPPGGKERLPDLEVGEESDDARDRDRVVLQPREWTDLAVRVLRARQVQGGVEVAVERDAGRAS